MHLCQTFAAKTVLLTIIVLYYSSIYEHEYDWEGGGKVLCGCLLLGHSEGRVLEQDENLALFDRPYCGWLKGVCVSDAKYNILKILGSRPPVKILERGHGPWPLCIISLSTVRNSARIYYRSIYARTQSRYGKTTRRQ